MPATEPCATRSSRRSRPNYWACEPPAAPGRRLGIAPSQPEREIPRIGFDGASRGWLARHALARRLIDEAWAARGGVPVVVAEMMECRLSNAASRPAVRTGF